MDITFKGTTNQLPTSSTAFPGKSSSAPFDDHGIQKSKRRSSPSSCTSLQMKLEQKMERARRNYSNVADKITVGKNCSAAEQYVILKRGKSGNFTMNHKIFIAE